MSQRRRALGAINLLCSRPLEWSPIKEQLLSTEGLIRAAERRTGLSDWGGQGFREPLEALVRSFESDVQLHPLGRWFFMRNVLLTKLVNRLLIQRDLKRAPEIMSVAIERPIFITGLPRTGTTLLHRMLAQLACVRTLQLWELLRPSPPPDWASYAVDRRRRQTPFSHAMRLVLGRSALKGLSAIHHSAAGEPEECSHLLMNSLSTVYFGMYGPARAYLDWLARQDMALPYQYYRRQLQLLTWRCARERLILKAPVHLRHLPALERAFPDACVIRTHRQMPEVVASSCSMVTSFRQLFSDAVSPLSVGQEMLEGLARQLTLADAFRPRSLRILDVSYDDLIRDPLRTLSRISDHCALPITPGCQHRVETYLASNPAHRHGRHRYQLASFGLTQAQVQRRFAAYQARHGV